MLRSLLAPTPLARRQQRWLVLVWLVLGVALGAGLWARHQDIDHQEREHLQQQAGIVHDNLVRQLKAIDDVLSRLVAEPLAAQPTRQEHRRANDRLQAFSEALAGVRTLSVFDAQGTVTASSRTELIGENFAYREYFRAARAAQSLDTLVVGEPFRAVQGGWYVTLSRLLADAEGAFGGMAMATLDPEQFLTLLDSVRYAPDMITGLTHGSGQRFLMVPQQQSSGAQDGLPQSHLAQPGTLFSRHMQSGAESSVLRGPMLPGSPEILAAVRTIRPPELKMDVPLLAGVARDPGAMYAVWRMDAWLLGGVWALAGAGAAGLLLLLVQRRRRDAQEHAQALAQREALLDARWRTVLEATGQGVWDWHMDGDKRYFSPEWKALLDHAAGPADTEGPLDADGAQDALAQWRRRLHPDDSAGVYSDLRRHLAGETAVFDNTHRLLCPDGHTLWLQVRGRVVERDSRGRALRFIGTYGDVTEQRQQQLKLDRLAENVPGALFQYQLEPDGRRHFPYASAGMQAIYGYPPQALRQDSAPALARIHPDDAAAVRANVERSAQALEVWRQEYRVVLPDQGERWISGQARPQRLEGGAVLWHGYVQDVTEAKQQALQLQETERLLKHLMNEMPIGLSMVDEAGRMYFRNRRFLDYFGYTEAEVPTMAEWWQRIYPDPAYREQVRARWGAALAQAAGSGGEVAAQDYRALGRDGIERTMAIGGLTFGGHFLATFVDRTEQQAQSELLRKLAYIDSLTGVANRRHFDQTLQSEWRRCRRAAEPLALMMVDLDHFKQFNDRYGHQAGDACMRAVATALRAGLARSHDLVARYGGEEFVCLLPGCGLEGATAKARTLCQAVQALAIEHCGSSTADVVTVSIGVAAQVPDGDGTPEALLARADACLYQAKAEGRNRVHDGLHSLS